MPNFEDLRKEAAERIAQAQDLSDLNQLRVQYLGKKGKVQDLMKNMKNLSKEEKPQFGKDVNALKQHVASRIEEKREELAESEMNMRIEREKIDITLPGRRQTAGNLHPLHIVTQELEDLFIGLGYQVIEGNDIVDDEYCFERANIPKDHPARAMQDSLYIDENNLLRTHTTAIQMKVLEQAAPNLPIKVVCPGKVYRRDDDDATHSHQFMQMEGLVVDRHITLADLKGTLEFLARKMFGQDRQIRFRPSYFPFTEPSVEVDVTCHICNGKGCPTCKGTGWIEILGAGEVHPNVLRMAGYDPEKCSGFAFGVGIERIAMLKYGVDDIRHFYTNDKRFEETFKRFE
ncbi:phenylalanine--tRNA ligase subunit alpha [Catenisphaera adipataccumulans]|uniref:Phenylalanine--tRNA ligase alpha subunit n=1 Tax=Catenisphaera adipataccumulans TaxID=700500 RepID=A0A7W8CYL2_9FIRM|nr:phenylalanine--tRNA ligase subunit alpha [Catenisphaera adipataccumulans]MBB5182808.1 phenylalanyl-tRNA synthetase alpha chain [Catenisphaera adipataccumulans]